MTVDDLYNAAPTDLVEELTDRHQRYALGIGAAVRTAWAAGVTWERRRLHEDALERSRLTSRDASMPATWDGPFTADD